MRVRRAAAMTVLTLATGLCATPISEGFFADKTVYGIPLHSYNGYDQEKFALDRLYEIAPRVKATIPLDYAPRGPIKTLEGWVCADSYVNEEGVYQTSYLPSFKNSYDEKGRITEKRDFSIEGPAVLVSGYYKYDYDAKGSMTRYREWGERGRFYRERRFAYDAAGRLMDADLSPGEGTNELYAYDAEGRLLEKRVREGGKAKTLYKAAYKGALLISETLYHPSGEAYSSTRFSYDAKGLCVEEAHEESSPTVDAYRLRHSYDAEGRRTETLRYDRYDAKSMTLSQKTSFGYSGRLCVLEREFDAEGRLVRSRARTFDSGGMIAREDLSYPDSGYSGPTQRYEAVYKGGLLAEERLLSHDDYSGKLEVAERLVFEWVGGKPSAREHYYRDSDGRTYLLERHRFFYDAKGQIFRDEYWQHHSDDGKLHLDQSSFYRFDGKEAPGSNPQCLPVLGNGVDYRPE
jgi:YD repeat-containing protein